ncbi:MAG: hypothetical protein S4CHLAM123_07790 [Chlamydiales bacterium]|nr:hypothetical protein [Chlamydiales bacterium]
MESTQVAPAGVPQAGQFATNRKCHAITCCIVICAMTALAGVGIYFATHPSGS